MVVRDQDDDAKQGRPDRLVRILVRHSGSPRDMALATELLVHLSPLEQFAGIHVWTDEQIRAGDQTHRKVNQAIEEADIALLLLSADFLGSTMLQDVEIPKLLERHRAGSLRVVPVVLRSCAWEMHSSLVELRPLPPDGAPIASFQGDVRDRVLTDVAREVVRLAMPIKGAQGERTTSEPGRTEATQRRALPHGEGASNYSIQIYGSTIGALGTGPGVNVAGQVTAEPAPSGSASGTPAGQLSATDTSGDLSEQTKNRIAALLDDAQPDLKSSKKRSWGGTLSGTRLKAWLIQGAEDILRRRAGIVIPSPYQTAINVCHALHGNDLLEYLAACSEYLAAVEAEATHLNPMSVQEFERRLNLILVADRWFGRRAVLMDAQWILTNLTDRPTGAGT